MRRKCCSSTILFNVININYLIYLGSKLNYNLCFHASELRKCLVMMLKRLIVCLFGDTIKLFDIQRFGSCYFSNFFPGNASHLFIRLDLLQIKIILANCIQLFVNISDKSSHSAFFFNFPLFYLPLLLV